MTQYLQGSFPAQTWITPVGLSFGAALILWGTFVWIREGGPRRLGQRIVRVTTGGPTRKVAHLAIRLNTETNKFEHSSDRQNIDFVESLSDGSVRVHFADNTDISPRSLFVRLANDDTPLPIISKSRTQVRFRIPNAQGSENYVLLFECGRRSASLPVAPPAPVATSRPSGGETASQPLEGRIPFIRFREIAAREFGWDFANYSNQILSLANGLRQAAIDNDVVLWGRQFGDGIPTRMKENYPLKPIPKAHLETWWLNVLMPTEDNVETETYNFERNYRSENYRDIHLHSEAAARAWLKNKGHEFKTPQPDVDAIRALIHIAHHSALGGQYNATPAFEMAARKGDLKVWGREIVPHHGEAAMDEIPRSYWQDAELDLSTLATFVGPKNKAAEYDSLRPSALRTRPLDNRHVPVYVGLRVNSKQVQALWPTTREGSPLG